MPMLCTFFFAFSCSKSGDDTPLNNDSLLIDNGSTSFNEEFLFDKWWYSENGIAYDIILSSDGTFQVMHPIGLGDSGTWTWVDSEHTKMELTVIPGGSNIINGFWIELSEVQSSTITLRLSDDDIEYSSLYSYTDTE